MYQANLKNVNNTKWENKTEMNTTILSIMLTTVLCNHKNNIVSRSFFNFF